MPRGLSRHPAATTPRAVELFAHPEWLGHEVTVDLYEPFRDYSLSSIAGPGEIAVDVTEAASSLVLSPGETADDRIAGAMTALPAKLRSPVRVTGLLTETKHGVRLAAGEIIALTLPQPAPLATVEELVKDPAAWSGRFVEVTDTWLVGFEASRLGDHVWLDLYPDVTIRCAPPQTDTGSLPEMRTARVRVVGFAYTAGHYGHGGRASAEIAATELVYVDPNRAECR